MQDIRVGFGMDLHRLGPNQTLVLGGVKVESELGTIGHSDADVLIHAISDAILGALNLRDIGYHFPDSDQAYKDIDSRKLLNKVIKLIEEKEYYVSNLDSTIVLESPKINPYIIEMQKELSGLLKVDLDRVSIKATTNEGVGDIGANKAIKAYASVLLCKP